MQTVMLQCAVGSSLVVTLRGARPSASLHQGLAALGRLFLCVQFQENALARLRNPQKPSKQNPICKLANARALSLSGLYIDIICVCRDMYIPNINVNVYMYVCMYVCMYIDI